MTTVVSQHVEGCERSDKEQVEHVNLAFIVLNNILKSLESISNSVPLTPH
jgi:hypothetical protein